MKTFLLILTIFIWTNTQVQSLKDLLLKKYPHCENVKIIPFKSNPNLFICILVYSSNWNGKLIIVNYKNGRIKWRAKFDKYTKPAENYILSAKQLTLKGFNYPIIEVYGETHYGNGSFYLYELKDKVARLLLRTYAVDEHLGYRFQLNHKYYSRLFKGGILTPIFEDFNHDGFADVKLIGTAQICLNIDNILKQFPVQKVFIYNKKKKQFIEYINERRGFKKNEK